MIGGISSGYTSPFKLAMLAQRGGKTSRSKAGIVSFSQTIAGRHKANHAARVGRNIDVRA